MRRASLALIGSLACAGLTWLALRPTGHGAAVIDRHGPAEALAERALSRADLAAAPESPASAAAIRTELPSDGDGERSGWSGPSERRAASAKRLATLAGWHPEDPRGLALADWLATRPAPTEACAARSAAALVQFNLDAAAWRQRLVELAGYTAAQRIAPALEFAAFDLESRELVARQFSGDR